MARPTTYDAALRDRLILATIDAVDRVGAAGLNLRDVARAAGTSTRAVYSLFGSRNALLAAAVVSGLSSFAADQHDAEPHGLRALGVAYRAWALSNPARYRQLFGGGLADIELTEEQARATADAMLPLTRAVAARVKPARVGDAVTAIWAQVHGLVSLQLSGLHPGETDWDAAYSLVLDACEAIAPGAIAPEASPPS